MTIDDAQLQAWLQQLVWPLARIGGVMMSAPVLGDASAPARVRLMLALGLSLIVVPLLPAAAPIAAFSADWWLRTVQEVALGLMLGFVLKLVFEAVILGGELIGNSMGLGFARMADPVRGTDVPVVGQFLNLTAVLLFLAFDGHLRLIELLLLSFQSQPDPGAVLGGASFEAFARLGSLIFGGAVSLALPTMAALLLVNLAFGVMSRSAPTLNGLAVGFPLALAVGLLLLKLDLPSLQRVLGGLLDQAWIVLDGFLGGGS